MKEDGKIFENINEEIIQAILTKKNISKPKYSLTRDQIK